jgi:hypothetical protein
MFTFVEMKAGWHHPVMTCDHCKRPIDNYNCASACYADLKGPVSFYHGQCLRHLSPRPKYSMDLDMFMVHAASSLNLDWWDKSYVEEYYARLRGDGAQSCLEELGRKIHQLN